MSLYRILAAMLLVVAMFAGFKVWTMFGFVWGAVTFVAVAGIAGVLHNSGDRKAVQRNMTGVKVDAGF